MVKRKNKHDMTTCDGAMRALKCALFVAVGLTLTACSGLKSQFPNAPEIPNADQIQHVQGDQAYKGKLFGIDTVFNVNYDKIDGYHGTGKVKADIEKAMQKVEGMEKDIEKCLKNPNGYPELFVNWCALAERMRGEKNKTHATTVIQSMINSTVEYDTAKADRGNVPGQDWITTAKELAELEKGICADVAIAKAVFLSRILGKENVWLVSGVAKIVKEDGTERQDGHAVCVVRLPKKDGTQGYYVLDGFQSNTAVVKRMADNPLGLGDHGEAIGKGLVLQSFILDAQTYFDEDGQPTMKEISRNQSMNFLPLLARRMDEKKFSLCDTVFFEAEAPLINRWFLLYKKQDLNKLKPGEPDTYFAKFDGRTEMELLEMNPFLKRAVKAFLAAGGGKELTIEPTPPIGPPTTVLPEASKQTPKF